MLYISHISLNKLNDRVVEKLRKDKADELIQIPEHPYDFFFTKLITVLSKIQEYMYFNYIILTNNFYNHFNMSYYKYWAKTSGGTQVEQAL